MIQLVLNHLNPTLVRIDKIVGNRVSPLTTEEAQEIIRIYQGQHEVADAVVQANKRIDELMRQLHTEKKRAEATEKKRAEAAEEGIETWQKRSCKDRMDLINANARISELEKLDPPVAELKDIISWIRKTADDLEGLL